MEVRWSLGDGRRVKFWLDRRVLNGPLKNYIISQIPYDQRHFTVSQYVDQDQQWNWEPFQVLVPTSVLLNIATYKPSASQKGEDVRFWGLSPSNRFTTNSAYDSLTGYLVICLTVCRKQFGHGRAYIISGPSYGWLLREESLLIRNGLIRIFILQRNVLYVMKKKNI